MKSALTKEKQKVMDALNLIDEQAEQASEDIQERKDRMKAYNLVANFILNKQQIYGNKKFNDGH